MMEWKDLGENPNSKLGTAVIACVSILLVSSFRPSVGWVLLCLVILDAPCIALLARYGKRTVQRSWLAFEAHLESGDIVYIRGRGSTYRLGITYSYSMNGSTYGGYYQQTFEAEEEAQHLLANLKQFGLRIRVHPRRPDRSVFDPRGHF